LVGIHYLDQELGQPRRDGGRSRKPITNADTLVMQITNGILEGTIKPGKFLGSERDISESYNVSRNTAREALRSLAALGAVEILAVAFFFFSHSSLKIYQA